MALTEKDIKKLSHLAKINIYSKGKKIVMYKLEGIMKKHETIQQVNTNKVEQMSNDQDNQRPSR